MAWVLTILGITALVVLHEFGHFVAAKAVGMRVERFSLFFPPKLVGIRRGETEYMIGSIPAGGYVKITGMSPNEEIPPEVAHRAYYRQPVWKRLVVIGAGPAMNILVAFAIFWAVDATSAERPLPNRVRIAGLEQGHPAAAVLRRGDVLVAVDGKAVHLNSNGEANYIPLISSQRCPGRQTEGCAVSTTVQLTVLRKGRRMSFAVVPRYNAKEKRALIGITASPVFEGESLGQAAGTSVSEMWRVTSLTVSHISKIFVSSKARKEVHSLVGVSDIASQEFGSSAPDAFYLLALISLSLAIINLFPFLPLDGGHIFWAVAEKVRRRPIPFAVMERASVVGVALVLVLFLIGFSNDIHTLSHGGFHIR
jgi:regulator of sigma E protease